MCVRVLAKAAGLVTSGGSLSLEGVQEDNLSPPPPGESLPILAPILAIDHPTVGKIVVIEGLISCSGGD